MRCPFCGYEETKVLDSRQFIDENSIRRRRECLKCGGRFTTYERYEERKILVIKKDGKRQSYNSKKLLEGIIKACEKRPVSYDKIEQIVENITETVRRGGKSEIDSREIGVMVMERLKKLDQVAYIRFASVYKEFRDLDQFLDTIKELKN